MNPTTTKNNMNPTTTKVEEETAFQSENPTISNQIFNKFHSFYSTINQTLKSKIPSKSSTATRTFTTGTTAIGTTTTTRAATGSTATGSTATRAATESTATGTTTTKSWGLSSLLPSFSLLYGVKKQSVAKKGDGMIRPCPAKVRSAGMVNVDSKHLFDPPIQCDSTTPPLSCSKECFQTPFVVSNTKPTTETTTTTVKQRIQSAKIRQMERKVDWLVSQLMATGSVKMEELNGLDVVGASSSSPSLMNIERFPSAVAVATLPVQETMASIPSPPPLPPLDFITKRIPTTISQTPQKTPLLQKKMNTPHATVSATPPAMMKSLLSEMSQVVLKPVVVGLLESEYGHPGRKSENDQGRGVGNADHLTRALKVKFSKTGCGDAGEETEVESESESCWE